MYIQGTESSVCNKWFEEWTQHHEKIEKIKQEYTDSLISLGFNPEGKDLLEIITFLANELNNTKAELADLKSYTELKFYKVSYGDV